MNDEHEDLRPVVDPQEPDERTVASYRYFGYQTEEIEQQSGISKYLVKRITTRLRARAASGGLLPYGRRVTYQRLDGSPAEGMVVGRKPAGSGGVRPRREVTDWYYVSTQGGSLLKCREELTPVE